MPGRDGSRRPRTLGVRVLTTPAGAMNEGICDAPAPVRMRFTGGSGSPFWMASSIALAPEADLRNSETMSSNCRSMVYYRMYEQCAHFKGMCGRTSRRRCTMGLIIVALDCPPQPCSDRAILTLSGTRLSSMLSNDSCDDASSVMQYTSTSNPRMPPDSQPIYRYTYRTAACTSALCSERLLLSLLRVRCTHLRPIGCQVSDLLRQSVLAP
ncbi:hypothetical protein PENSPDRAFT_476299 [Peniophora sp. CONT]|nr:hypothetical protein PENSPDRAFT_476299 [Peniophora sp. CONT]